MKLPLPPLASTALLTGLLAMTSCQPDSSPPSPPNPPEQADPYLGQRLAQASAHADRAGLRWRVIREDGVSRPVTMDFQPERLNFDVKHGRVIRVTKG